MNTITPSNMPEHQVDTPVITLRWKLSNKQLVLGKRHLKNINALLLPDGLVAWIHQHIEWTLPDAIMDDPSGVLVIDIDKQEHAKMDVEPYVALQDTSVKALSERVLQDSLLNNLAPQELLWIYSDGAFTVLCDESQAISAAQTLALDLSKALNISVLFSKHARIEDAQELLLVSDEHGFVGAEDKSGDMTKRFEMYWNKLCESKQ